MFGIVVTPYTSGWSGFIEGCVEFPFLQHITPTTIVMINARAPATDAMTINAVLFTSPIPCNLQ
jgi:hypothetical protein